MVDSRYKIFRLKDRIQSDKTMKRCKWKTDKKWRPTLHSQVSVCNVVGIYCHIQLKYYSFCHLCSRRLLLLLLFCGQMLSRISLSHKFFDLICDTKLLPAYLTSFYCISQCKLVMCVFSTGAFKVQVLMVYRKKYTIYYVLCNTSWTLTIQFQIAGKEILDQLVLF